LKLNPQEIRNFERAEGVTSTLFAVFSASASGLTGTKESD
jgi:hypothetical protein